MTHFLITWITIAIPAWVMYRLGYRRGRADLIHQVQQNLEAAQAPHD